MKAVKDRLRRVILSIAARTKDPSEAGPNGPSTPHPPRAGTSPRAGGERRRPQRAITKISGGDLTGLYDIGGHVAESARPGTEVRVGRRRSSGEQVAMKTWEKSSFGGAREEREWRKTTVAQLNMPKNEGMCEYLAVYETREKYFVVMEWVEGVDLLDHVEREHVDQEGARGILLQMLGALEAMHAYGRIHKGLNLECFMVDLSPQLSPRSPKTSAAWSPREAPASPTSSSGSRSPKMSRVISNGSRASVATKLIDFDTAGGWDPSSPKKAKDVLGTPGYIAPEAYSGDYSPASDVYSVGVIMYRLLTGRLPSSLETFTGPPGENWIGSPAMNRIRDRLKNTTVDTELVSHWTPRHFVRGNGVHLSTHTGRRVLPRVTEGIQPWQ